MLLQGLLQGMRQGLVGPQPGARPSSRGQPKQHFLQPLDERLGSHSNAGPSGSSRCAQRERLRGVQVAAQLFGPPVFDARKLRTTFLPGTSPNGPPNPRRYTLTHNDLTGQLSLSIGAAYNTAQVSGWYTRLIRDEVLAEWRYDEQRVPSLHVHCHVSGEERWLAPPALRNFIFQREMPLVLDTVIHADRLLLSQTPHLASADVFVHLSSHVQELNMTVRWGVLSQRASWPLSSPSLLLTWRRSLRAPAASAAAAAETAAAAALPQPAATSPAPAMEQSGGDVLLPDGSPAHRSVGGEAPGVTLALADELGPADELIMEGLLLRGAVVAAAAVSVSSGKPGSSLLTDGAQSLPERPDGDSAEDASAAALLDRGFVLPATTASAAADGLDGRQAECGGVGAYSSGGNEGDDGSSSVTGVARAELQRRAQGSSADVAPSSGMHSLHASLLECSRADSLSSGQPITARDIVSEWCMRGHEVVTVRL